MKKKLEGQLVSIAHRILKLKGKEDLIKMHKEVSNLYEVISAVKFLEENNFDKSISEKEEQSSFWESIDTAFNNKVSDSIEVDDVVYVNVDEKKDTVEIEPAMEKIKDIVAQMPEDYFLLPKRQTSKWQQQKPILRFIVVVAKNILGLSLIIGGLLMLVLPGQGLLTIVTGLLLINYPGKYKLEQKLVLMPSIYKALNWIRFKAKKPPLQRKSS